ncbi:MAG: DUF4143 domain-containing protein, partial [Lachnospiraceae bacterium]|nr:DUF4143 domain-containing protein [Lachnospiraceae bacterium]
VKTPKMYFMDTGLAAYLCRWPNAETLENGAMDGAFFKTYVISEIVKATITQERDRIYITIGILTEKKLTCYS